MKEIFVQGAKIFGIDIGGNDGKFGALEFHAALGKFLPTFELDPHQIRKLPSDTRLGPAATIKRMREAYDQLSLPKVEAIGVATAGPASLLGKIGQSTNYGDLWTDFEFGKAVEDYFQLPVKYENDANAAAYGELNFLMQEFPELANSHRFLLTIGTGLGGGIVVNGEIFRGARGMGGEVGHIALRDPLTFGEKDPGVCGCGRIGCAEAFTSLGYLDRQLEKLLPIYENHELNQFPRYGENGDPVRAKQLLRLAGQGDPLSERLILGQATNVGKTCFEITAIVDPAWILIGGGITEGTERIRDLYLKEVERAFNELTFRGQKDTLIRYASKGDHAGWLGAAFSAVDMLRKRAA